MNAARSNPEPPKVTVSAKRIRTLPIGSVHRMEASLG
jgi:hypothetical protein